MKKEVEDAMRVKCEELTEREYNIHPRRSALIGELNKYRRAHDKVGVTVVKAKMDELRKEIYDTLWKGIADMDASIKAADSIEDKERLNDLIGAQFILADMIESVSMDLESMTRKVIVGDYNPFAQLEIRTLIQRLRRFLACIYQDAPADVADEFARAADRMLPMVTNNARSALKRANGKEAQS